MNIFVEALIKKLMAKSFFCDKTKMETFLENRGQTFSDVENNFTKIKVYCETGHTTREIFMT